MNGNVSAVGHLEIVEFDLYFARRREISVQCLNSAFSIGHAFELNNLACDLGSNGHNEFVKSVDGLSDAAASRLADLLDFEFLIENNLNSGAFRNRERDGLYA